MFATKDATREWLADYGQPSPDSSMCYNDVRPTRKHLARVTSYAAYARRAPTRSRRAGDPCLIGRSRLFPQVPVYEARTIAAQVGVSSRVVSCSRHRIASHRYRLAIPCRPKLELMLLTRPRPLCTCRKRQEDPNGRWRLATRCKRAREGPAQRTQRAVHACNAACSFPPYPNKSLQEPSPVLDQLNWTSLPGHLPHRAGPRSSGASMTES
jgi:hypothetical protein